MSSYYLELAKRYASPVSNDPEFIRGLAEEIKSDAERQKREQKRAMRDFIIACRQEV
mgnify:CR=1 FL=1